MITRELVSQSLACPICKGLLVLSTGDSTDNKGFADPIEGGSIVCAKCNLSFELSQGVPNLLPQPLFPIETEQPADPGWQEWACVMDTFQNWAYEKFDLDGARISRYIYDQFFRFARIRGSVIDIGGGDGIARHWLREACYLDVDPDPRRAHYPHPFFSELYVDYHNPFYFVQGVAEYLPIQSEIFDNALFIQSLDYCADIDLALSEARRVIRPAGRLFLLVHVSDQQVRIWEDALLLGITQGPLGLFKAARGKLISRNRAGRQKAEKKYHVTTFSSIAGLASSLERHGFADVTWAATKFAPQFVFLAGVKA